MRNNFITRLDKLREDNKPFRILMSDIFLLCELFYNPGTTIKEITVKYNLDYYYVNQRKNILLKNGFIFQSKNIIDKRKNQLYLSNKNVQQ